MNVCVIFRFKKLSLVLDNECSSFNMNILKVYHYLIAMMTFSLKNYLL